MFDAAHAALLAAGVSAKTHSGLISAFGKHLVQSGLIDAQHGRALNRVHHLRQLADYLGDPVSIGDATESFDHAQAFVAAIKTKFLPKESPEK
jgi:uncharacterized protein (UPF0332 family)